MKPALTLSTILVGFSGSKGWLGWLIRKFSGKTDINHEFIAYFDPITRGWVNLGADTGGWMETPFENLRSNAVVRLYAPPPGVDLQTGIAAMRSMLGVNYDFGGLVGMTWVIAMRRIFGKRVRNPFARKTSLFCSEAVDMILDRSGVDLGLPDESAVDPATGERALRAWLGPTGGFDGPYTIDDVLATSVQAAA
jgi:hypothetical protein